MDRKLNFDLHLDENITWQYDQAVRMAQLISSKSNWYKTYGEDFFNGWYTSVFNLKTANRFGCVVWAIILNVPVGLIFSPMATRPPFGFGGGRENFDDANFFGAGSLNELTLDEARRLLRVRYYAQTMSPNVTNINGMLKDVFGDLGLAYIEETVGGTLIPPFGFGQYRQNFAAPSNFNTSGLIGNVQPMVQKYIFQFALSANFKDALNTYLPRGSAVQSSIVSP